MSDKIKFRCTCGKKLSVPPERAGRKTQCPVCEKVFRAPTLDAGGKPPRLDASAKAEPGRVRLGAEDLDAAGPSVGDDAGPGRQAEEPQADGAQLVCEKCGKPVAVPEGSVPKMIKCRSCFYMMPVPPGFGVPKTSAARLFAAHIADAAPAKAKKGEDGSDSAAAYIECDQCGKQIPVPKGARTKMVKCKSCFHMVPVPMDLLPREQAKSGVIDTAGAIHKTLSTDIICTCVKCNTRFVLGVNARVAEIGRTKMEAEDGGPSVASQTTTKRPPDQIELLDGQASWPEGVNPPEPTHEVPERIKYAREQEEYRKWHCGKCKHVQQYVW